MQPKFVHLRLHTEFSLIDGIVKIKPLVAKLVENDMPAIALTDQTNLFSLVKYYKAAIAHGIKPIVGADVYVYNSDEPARPFSLTFLVMNKIGYTTLTQLISRAYQEGQHQGIPMLKKQWIVQNHQGLIALSGAMEGEIGKALLAENVVLAKAHAEEWGQLFEGNYYLELQRVGKPGEERYIQAAINLAISMDLPVVATNDVRFIKTEDFAAHEVRVCIHQGRVLEDSRRPKNYTDQQFLRSEQEMVELFSDIPEALQNTTEIARRCNLELELGENYLPDFPVPEGLTLDEYFVKTSRQGLRTAFTGISCCGI